MPAWVRVHDGTVLDLPHGWPTARPASTAGLWSAQLPCQRVNVCTGQPLGSTSRHRDRQQDDGTDDVRNNAVTAEYAGHSLRGHINDSDYISRKMLV